MSPAIVCPIYREIALLPLFFLAAVGSGHIYSEIAVHPLGYDFPIYTYTKMYSPLLRDEGRGCGDDSICIVK